MPNFNIIKEIEANNTFRVNQICSSFDLQTTKIKEHFIGNLQIENKEWNIGVIVGNSGTGKTTIAKELFGNNIVNYTYNEKSVIDDFNKEISVKEIFKVLNNVGFSSPTSWLKPYSVLSNGEKMRVDLARAILENKEIIIFDEFTSVVDRNIAKIGSYAISKSIKKTNKKIILISCHYDILEWLEPDWVFNTNNMEFKDTRGVLRRPTINLEIRECKSEMWKYFRKYHYLDTNLNKSAKCFVGLINNELVCFNATLHFPHPSSNKIKKEHRTVVLPDYQGISIGSKFSDYIAEYFKKKGFKYMSVTSNPAFINHRLKSNRWKLKRYGRLGNNNNELKKTSSKNRLTFSWEFL